MLTISPPGRIEDVLVNDGVHYGLHVIGRQVVPGIVQADGHAPASLVAEDHS